MKTPVGLEVFSRICPKRSRQVLSAVVFVQERGISLVNVEAERECSRDVCWLTAAHVCVYWPRLRESCELQRRVLRCYDLRLLRDALWTVVIKRRGCSGFMYLLAFSIQMQHSDALWSVKKRLYAPVWPALLLSHKHTVVHSSAATYAHYIGH